MAEPILVIKGRFNETETKNILQGQLNKIGENLHLTIGVDKNGSKQMEQTSEATKKATQSLNQFEKGLQNLINQRKVHKITEEQSLKALDRMINSTAYQNQSIQTQIKLMREFDAVERIRTQNIQNEQKALSTLNAEVQRNVDANNKRKASEAKVAGKLAESQAELDVRKKMALQDAEMLRINANKYKLTRDQRAELERQYGIIRQLNTVQATSTTQINDQVRQLRLARNEMQGIYSEARATGRGALNFGVMFESALKSMAVWMSATTVFFQLIRAVQNGVKAIYEFDKAMTELRKVSEESNETLNAFGASADAIALSLGRTSAEVVAVTADFTKMGYALSEAIDMGKDALMLANVGEGFNTVDEASSALVTTLKGFNFESSETGRIMDILNELSNKYAVTSGGLAEALKRSSAVMAIAGNTLEQTTALMTSGIEVMQSPEKVSRGN